jgi:hypothetical protein
MANDNDYHWNEVASKPVAAGPAFDLMVAKMDTLKADMRRQLNEDLFGDALRYAVMMPRRPLTWRDHLRNRLRRITAYWVTLGRALRGDDPYDSESDGY